MSRTGGGRGTNQYKVRGIGQQMTGPGANESPVCLDASDADPSQTGGPAPRVPERIPQVDWGRWEHYGVRWTDDELDAGDPVPGSLDWCGFCQEPYGSRPPEERICGDCINLERAELGGACSLEVSAETLVERLSETRYPAAHAYVIASNTASYGEDQGEMILGTTDYPAVVAAVVY